MTTFSQATTGGIEGMVADQSGAAISGATVSIENTDDTPGLRKNISSDADGTFILAAIPPGKYKISVRAPNFSDFSDELEVLAGMSTMLNPILNVGQPISNPDYVNKLTSGSSKGLPVKTTFSSILKYTPAVRPEVFAGGFQIDGSSGSENTYFIDGQEVTNFRTGLLDANNNLPLELLQEVQVIADRTEARFGDSFGGVINVITKGGNNRWRGEYGTSFTPATLQGKPNVFLNRFGSSSGQLENFQPKKDGGNGFFPTATLSGPIIKDRIWFFSSYSPQIYTVDRTIDYFTTGSNPVNRAVRESIKYESNVRTEAAFLRLDSQPTSNLRVFGSFLYNPIIQNGALPSNTEGFSGVPQTVGNLRGAAFLAERGGRQNSNVVNGQVSWNVTNIFLLNFRAGRGFLNEKLNSYGVPSISRFICASGFAAGTTPGSNCSSGFQNIANNSVLEQDVSTRTTFDAEGALFGVKALGRHNFRFGYQFNRLFNDVKEGYADTGIVTLYYGRPISSLIGLNSTPGNLGSGFLQRFGTVGEASSRNQSIFAQDSWQVTRPLTLNLGVRFENEVVPNYGTTNSEDIVFGWGDKIAPRLGFAFDLTGDGKTTVSGGYGWYYDRLKYELPRELFGGILFRRDYFEILPSRGAAYTNYTLSAILGGRPDIPGGTCPIIGGPGFSVCQFDFRVATNLTAADAFTTGAVDPDLQAARQSEYTIGVERALAKNIVLGGRYIHKKLDRAIEDIGVFDNQGSQAFIIGNPGFGLVCEIGGPANLPCAKAERDYDAFEVVLDTRAPQYFFNANYTWSRLIGNYSGLASSDEFGLASPNSTAYFNLPSQGFTASGQSGRGRLATDRPHVFKANGGYSFAWRGNTNRTSVSAFTTIQSGTPLTTIYSLYGVSTSILFERGDLGRTEMFSETDLRIGHRYSFGTDSRFSVEPYFVVLNVFGERNELARQTSISATNFTSSTLPQGGCTTCSGQAAAYDTLFNRGGIRPFVQNFLNLRGVSSTGLRNDYNQPTLFQDARYVRFGARFQF